jgi:hypothetical protein
VLVLLVAVMLVAVMPARAGTLYGRLDVQGAPDRPPPATHGFLERVENPLAPVRPVAVASQMVIVLEGDEKPVSPPQVTWILAGESFTRPVVAAPAGAEVVIRDDSKIARTLVAAEDARLIPAGPINPTGTKSFRVTEAGKVYTIGDRDAPHVKGKLVVVNSQFIAYPDEQGRYEIGDVPAGPYKLKIWYRDRWLEIPNGSVDVATKGKTDFNPRIPAAALAGAAKK